VVVLLVIVVVVVVVEVIFVVVVVKHKHDIFEVAPVVIFHVIIPTVMMLP